MEERMAVVEQKLACLEQKFQGTLAEEPNVRKLTADISILAHTIVAIANDYHAGNINAGAQYLSKAKQHLAAAKEALFRSQLDSE